MPGTADRSVHNLQSDSRDSQGDTDLFLNRRQFIFATIGGVSSQAMARSVSAQTPDPAINATAAALREFTLTARNPDFEINISDPSASDLYFPSMSALVVAYQDSASASSGFDAIEAEVEQLDDAAQVEGDVPEVADRVAAYRFKWAGWNEGQPLGAIVLVLDGDTVHRWECNLEGTTSVGPTEVVLYGALNAIWPESDHVPVAGPYDQSELLALLPSETDVVGDVVSDAFGVNEYYSDFER